MLGMIIRVLALFDHEEIGSNSLCGAEGNSLSCLITSLSGSDNVSQAIRKSFLLSYVSDEEKESHLGCGSCIQT